MTCQSELGLGCPRMQDVATSQACQSHRFQVARRGTPVSEIPEPAFFMPRETTSSTSIRIVVPDLKMRIYSRLCSRCFTCYPNAQASPLCLRQVRSGFRSVDDALSIVIQIDHQDLASVIKDQQNAQ